MPASHLTAAAVALVATIGYLWLRRRQTEKSARLQQLFELVLENIHVGITVQGPTGALLYANSAAANIIGFPSPEALVAAPLAEVVAKFDMFHFDGTPFPREEMPSRMALSGRSSGEIPIRFKVRGTREERWSLVRAEPVRGSDGKVAYAINFFREVTEETREAERKAFLLRAVDELNSSLEYQRTLAAVARMAVPTLADWCAVDLVEGDAIRRVAIAHVDPARIALVEALERRYPPDPAAASGVPQIIRTGQAQLVAEIPAEMLRSAARDAEHLRLIDQLELRSYIGVPLVVRGKAIGALTFAMAESGRRYSARDLELARSLADRGALAIENASLLLVETRRREEAEEGARFAEKFVAILGHDLRNPLNAVMMAANLLRRRIGDAKELARIDASGQRMSRMIDQLLDLTRSRLAGGISIARAPTDLGAVIAGVLDELRLSYPGRDVRWTPGEARGPWDPDRLAQVMSNLAANALEHGDPAAPVDVELITTEDFAEVEVRNAGAAIPAEQLENLFEPYRRGMVRDPRSRGLGLGLFISRQIVLAHGGSIDAASSPDEGTRFRVRLPMQQQS